MSATTRPRLKKLLLKIAPLRMLLGQRHEMAFRRNLRRNLFRGVYQSFDAALASAPSTRPVGYDHEAAAAMYLDRTRRVYPSDYPVLFWLERLIGAGVRRIVDFGGHVGVSYYAYRKYIRYPIDLSWRVFDLPAVTTRGRELAKTMDHTGQIAFCDQLADCADMELIIAQGSLQYLIDTLPERLRAIDARPRHVLLNLVPIHASQSYFTLQSIGTAFCPYRITALTEFVESFEALGYGLVDRWENADKSCHIPLHPEQCLDSYNGFLFSLPDASSY